MSRLRPERHCGGYARVEHPLREFAYDACFDLNVDDASASALLAIVDLALRYAPLPCA